MITKELRKQIAEETGFECYENESMTGAQVIWYGTSDEFDNFKTLVGTLPATGTVVDLMDTGAMYIYSKFKNQWYTM